MIGKVGAVRRGYDLRTQLPALFGEGPEQAVARVKCDYRETISERLDASNWPLRDSGLLGLVRLIPLKKWAPSP
jgi:hypothetical protein